MQTRTMEFRTAIVSLSGAVLWAGLAVLAGLRRAPLGVIELLLLLAVLVMAPLGFRLSSGHDSESLAVRARFVQAFETVAALAVVASFWLRPGLVAAALSVPWFAVGVVAGVAGAWSFYRGERRSLADLAVSLVGVDLALASGWLVVSRAGLHPLGFQEPIVLLTSVHFHYSGFAIAVLAAAAIRACERRGVGAHILRGIIWALLFLPYLLAAGFVISPALRMVAGLALALTVPAFAACLLWISRFLDRPVARNYMRLGVVAAWVAMGLAGAYAVTDYVGKPFLTMPGMASTHGVLNGIGFVLCSTLAFLIEENAVEPALGSGLSVRRVVAGPVLPRKRPTGVPSHVPEFVAREFYDR